MIGRPSRGPWHHAGKAQGSQIQLVNESLNDADRIVWRNIVVQTRGQQHRLPAILTFNETLHPALR